MTEEDILFGLASILPQKGNFKKGDIQFGVRATTAAEKDVALERTNPVIVASPGGETFFVVHKRNFLVRDVLQAAYLGVCFALATGSQWKAAPWSFFQRGVMGVRTNDDALYPHVEALIKKVNQGVGQ